MISDPIFPPDSGPGPGGPPPLEHPELSSGNSGLPRNIAAALSCIVPLVGGVAFYVLDRRDRFVRFYAWQSIVLGGVFFVLGLAIRITTSILSFIPLLGKLFAIVLSWVSGVAGLVFLVFWLVLIVMAYRGKTWEMPFLWPAAKRHIPPPLL